LKIAIFAYTVFWL